jgi:hypothetical protein
VEIRNEWRAVLGLRGPALPELSALLRKQKGALNAVPPGADQAESSPNFVARQTISQ